MGGKKADTFPSQGIKDNFLLRVLLLYMINVTLAEEIVSFKNDSKHNGHSADIFTRLLCKNVVKIRLGWLLTCAASLHSCDLVDLKRHRHYSWLPGGGAE